jgi:hypothetical protein
MTGVDSLYMAVSQSGDEVLLDQSIKRCHHCILACCILPIKG